MNRECAIQSNQDGDNLCLTFLGSWTIHVIPCTTPDISNLFSSQTKSLSFDTEKLNEWDSRLLVKLAKIIEFATSHGIAIDDHGLPSGVRSLLKLTQKGTAGSPSGKKNIPTGLFEEIGNHTLGFFSQTLEMLIFTGEILVAYIRLFTGRARFLKKDLTFFLYDCGPQALPIVTLISFLVGFILAFIGAVQLKMFGADIYVANLVGLAMTREMGAMMAAIIMAGRTGASFAAQLGTMQVNEEIDALQTMGINPFDFLVLPRMTALIIMMPLLAIWADFIGILGGFFIGCFTLDISPILYYEQTVKAITINHFSVGIIKAVVFGYLVAYCGCLKGMHCGRSADAVGKATTSAVVTAIVFIVMSDAAFTFIFNIIGI
jgi:phospholipid/cholesterol/gamma-HCH transport system permease protein